MKNVVAYSLWGEHPMYWVGALRNIELVNKYFPGWICRFYIDKNCKQELTDTLKGDNTELAMKQGFPANGMGGMYGKPVAMREDCIHLDYYPAEKFFWEHIKELGQVK
jgi:hypothetical protein